MCRFRFLLAFTASLYFITASHGAMIVLDHPKRDAVLGVKVFASGPLDAPVASDALQLLGGAFGTPTTSSKSEFYSGKATFEQPITSVSMTIENIGYSDWENDFTLVAFDKGRRVAHETIRLAPAGDGMTITLSEPSIDKVKWFGEGWTFHPYMITEMSVTFAPVMSAPQVSSPAPAPEPAFALIAGPLFIFVLLQRRRTGLRRQGIGRNIRPGRVI